MRHPHFAIGLADIRAGRTFNDRLEDDLWAYERGRLFGAIAPLSLPLLIGKKLNPVAIRVFAGACERGWIR
jgi:hypothetical protein